MRSQVLAHVSEAGLASRVHLTGFIPEDRILAAAFQEARVFALPSEYEAFGLVLLEAMAQGTPVIASRVGGIPEFVPDPAAGRLVPPDNAPALAEALLAVWDDKPMRRRMGEFGRTQVVPRYSWDRVVDRLLPLYHEVAGR
jgi:D-inositol-3-phosphate glycosyltransferase